MKAHFGIIQLLGFAVTSLGGTLLHFLYEWTNESIIVAPFSGVNESTFEHMKLLFWPMFVYAIAESLFFNEYKSFWCVKMRGILIGLGLIPVLFYTYNGVIGKSPDFINISIFFISAGIAYIYETRAFKKETVTVPSPRVAFTVLCVIALLFVVFTFNTPMINIFKDPITGTYGI